MGRIKIKLGFLGIVALGVLTLVILAFQLLLWSPLEWRQVAYPFMLYIVMPLGSVAFIVLGIYALVDGARILLKPHAQYRSEDNIDDEPKQLTKGYDIIADKIANVAPRLGMGLFGVVMGTGLLWTLLQNLLS